MIPPRQLTHRNTPRVAAALAERAEAGDPLALICLAKQDVPEAVQKTMAQARKMTGETREKYLGIVVSAISENRAAPSQVEAFLVEMLQSDPPSDVRAAGHMRDTSRSPRCLLAVQHVLLNDPLPRL